MMTFKVVDIKLKRLRKAGDQTTAICGVLIKRAFRCLSKRIWRRIMINIRSCRIKPRFNPFSSISYHRLKRNFSDSFVTEIRDLEAGHGDFCSAKGSMTPVSDMGANQSGQMTPCTDAEADDTVVLKTTMLGDSETGKTSFMARKLYSASWDNLSGQANDRTIKSEMAILERLVAELRNRIVKYVKDNNFAGSLLYQVKYVSSQENEDYFPTQGISCMEKVFRVKGAKIAFSIWDLGGHQQFTDMVPLACQDAAAILFTFDLTRRSTLNSVMDWYKQARRWNQIALPVLIGTKFDQFISLPHDIQLTIVEQATAYCSAMEGVLFFSSVTHNINVQKIFKVITAKLFDLPCSIARNCTVGEPLVYY